MTNKIHPCLWFDGNAKEAAEFYCSVFKDSWITDENPFVVTFESSGQKFMCLNGGPKFKMNPSISFFVLCETEEETETLWRKLLEGGSALMPLDQYAWSQKYGWLQDKYGASWQLSLDKMENVGQKFTPVLMFSGDQNGKAEKAIGYYTSVFKDADIVGVLKYEKGDKDVEGNVKHAQFRLNGQVLMAMDSSIQQPFGFSEGISLVVNCRTQKEIDHFWNNLSRGGSEDQCGWLKDQFGISWQIVPEVLGELMGDPSKAGKVTEAFLKMKKFEIDKLVEAGMG